MTKPRQNSSIWSCARRRRNGKCRRANGARRKPSSPSCSKTGSSWHDGQPAPHTRFLTVPALFALELSPQPDRPGKDSNACMGLPVNGFLRLKSLVPLTFFLLAPFHRSAQRPQRVKARCLANQIVRVSLYPVEPHGLATMIPPARNGLRSNGPISLSVLHPSIAPVTSNPSSETRAPLKPSRPCPPGSIPSRGTAIGPRSACAPKQRSQ